MSLHGRYFKFAGRQFFVNVHWLGIGSRVFSTHLPRRNPNHGRPIWNVLILGIELSWWRA